MVTTAPPPNPPSNQPICVSFLLVSHLFSPLYLAISHSLSFFLSEPSRLPLSWQITGCFLQCLASDTVADVFIKSISCERGGLSEGATGRTEATTHPRTTTTAHWWELMQRPICREVGETRRIRTWAFQSRYSNLLEFVCLALKSSFTNPDGTRERERGWRWEKCRRGGAWETGKWRSKWRHSQHNPTSRDLSHFESYTAS